MRHELTELEGITLGWIRGHEPATPYAVRVQFEQSPSSRFTGSAGAIYPLMRRLEKRGLLASEPTATGRRTGRAYRVTPEGTRALRAWLKSPLEPADMFTIDPLRTRVLYLQHLGPAERDAWVDKAERCLREQLALISDYEALHADDPFHRLANDNARRETRARLAWIRAVRAALS